MSRTKPAKRQNFKSSGLFSKHGWHCSSFSVLNEINVKNLSAPLGDFSFCVRKGLDVVLTGIDPPKSSFSDNVKTVFHNSSYLCFKVLPNSKLSPR